MLTSTGCAACSAVDTICPRPLQVLTYFPDTEGVTYYDPPP